MTSFTPEDREPTIREKQTLVLLQQGYSNAAIAKLMGISANTVKHYITVLFDKVGCSTRVELALMRFEETPRQIKLRKRTLRIKEAQLKHELACVQDELRILKEEQHED